ncbi:MAG TPA: SDR family NAD(P)-dependent oxidoreductase [Steroidobacteraceae bacterium]|nr:SDR family NAD(P)-dependent oxidoreductase [Steroidobacteraceae bacterium]
MATQRDPSAKPLAIVTGASSGIGRELAILAARAGFDLIVAADTSLDEAMSEARGLGANVEAVECDLATVEGVDKVVRAASGRPVAALLANAGHGLGRGFLDQEFADIEHVLDTNVTGTIYLVHQIGRQMRDAGAGRILFTGSIAGYVPGSFQAVYNATKAFIDSFALALRNELKDTGVTVTCLMPGVTDTEFFERADLMDTKVGTQDDKADPADVAKIGFDAMMNGEADVVAGMKNKLQVAMAGVMPKEALAEQHRKMAEPGSAQGKGERL